MNIENNSTENSKQTTGTHKNTKKNKTNHTHTPLHNTVEKEMKVLLWQTRNNSKYTATATGVRDSTDMKLII